MKRLKRGFTLIELLAVIIILAVVALIATPLILNVIEDSRKSAGLSQAYLILDGAEQFYANALIDPDIGYDKLNGLTNIYKDITFSGEKPESAQLFITRSGDVSLSYFHEGFCYSKGIDENEITQIESTDEKCNETVIKPSGPNITFTDSGILNTYSDDFWHYKEAEVYVNASNLRFKYCVSNGTCIPDIDGVSSNLTVTTENNYVCVDIYDGDQITKSMCEVIAFDPVVPTISPIEKDIEINHTLSYYIPSFFNVTFGKSDGIVTCNHMETSKLQPGTHEITCKAIAGNGVEVEATKNIIIKELVYTPESDFTMYLGSATYIGTEQHIVVPETINGTSVTAVGISSETGTEILSIVLPNTITKLSDYSFRLSTLEAISPLENVTYIGRNSFIWAQLQSVVMPKAYVDHAAFSQSNSLRYIEGTGNALAFSQTSIEHMIISEGTETISSPTSINYGYSNKGIKFLTLPSNPLTIGKYAFQNNDIKSLILPEGVIVEEGAFTYNKIEELVIPKGATIKSAAFANNELKTIIIEDGASVDLRAFVGNDNIESIYLNGECIGCGFYISKSTGIDIGSETVIENLYINAPGEISPELSCSTDAGLPIVNIENIYYREGYTTISSVGYNCGTKNIHLPNSAITLEGISGDYEKITIPTSVTSIGGFHSKKLEQIILPNGIKSIPDSAFYLCNSLSEIIMSDEITSIGDSAFRGTDLRKITLPKELITIGLNAFQYNENLTEVIFGDKVTTIGKEAFYNTNIKFVEVPPTVQSTYNVFSGATVTVREN